MSAQADEAEVIARAAFAMAERFARGGTLFAVGAGSAATDAQHVAVEFMHPVLVGKRALPALALAPDQLATLCGPDDIALGICRDSGEAVLGALGAARERGVLTVALTAGVVDAAVDHHLPAPSDDPLAAKEVHVTAYHLLWELVHVFFDQPEVCITCSDQAVEVVVVELLGDQLAHVDTDSGVEQVSVALVDVAVGDRILVHAGEAIAVVGR